MPRLLLVLLLLLTAPLEARADAREEVAQALRAMIAAERFELTGTALVEEQEQGFQIAVVLPDRFRLNSPQGDFILVPEGAFLKQGENWIALPMDLSELTQAFTPEGVEASIEAIIEAEALGEEELDGQRVKVYRIGQILDLAERGLSQSSGRIWVGADGRPVRMEQTSAAGGPATVIDQRIRYPSDLEIKAPL